MKSLKLNLIVCFLFFIFLATVKVYAQCSIDKILLFNFGENSLNVLSNIYSNENLQLNENYSYEALNNVKDETKGKFLRHIVIEINNSDCFKDDLLKQTCHLRFINDILYSQNFLILFTPKKGVIAKKYFDELQKNLMLSIGDSKFYKLIDDKTNEEHGNGSEFIIDKDCNNYKRILLEFDFVYKSYLNSKRTSVDLGEIDFFRIEIRAINLSNTNFNCHGFSE